jgi:hypothetical protein
VLTLEEQEVLERSASRTMSAGDIFFGQLVASDGITLMEACARHSFAPGEKLGLIDLRERMAGGSPPVSRDKLAATSAVVIGARQTGKSTMAGAVGAGDRLYGAGEVLTEAGHCCGRIAWGAAPWKRVH